MHFLPSYLYLSREAWIGAGVGFVVAMAVMWLLVWAGRRRYVIVGNSPTVDLIAFHLGRIADTLDHVSIQSAPPLRGFQRARQSVEAEREMDTARDSQEASPAQEHARAERRVPAGRISMSIFGR